MEKDFHKGVVGQVDTAISNENLSLSVRTKVVVAKKVPLSLSLLTLWKETRGCTTVFRSSSLPMAKKSFLPYTAAGGEFLKGQTF